MSSSAITLPFGACSNDRLETFTFPESWQLTVCPPTGGVALTQEQIRQEFANPVASDTIRERAAGAKSAAILIDDFRRPTPAETLGLLVLEELKQAGIPKEKICVVLGNGGHRSMTEEECRTRLGAIMDQVGEVISHDAFSDDMAFMGTTAFGTPVLVNRQAAEADFSISISTVYPHVLTGWGGGAKMVLPGIAHVASCYYHHSKSPRSQWGCDPDDSRARLDIEEAASIFGLDMSICCVIGEEKKLIGLRIGDPTAAHRSAVELARPAYHTEMPIEPDLVIANAYPMDGDPTQLGKTEIPARRCGKPVLILVDYADFCDWHGVYHGPQAAYLAKPAPVMPEYTEERLAEAEVFMYCPQAALGYVPANKNHYCDHDWDRLMQAMQKRFPQAKAAVLPVAPFQIIEQ